MIVSVDRKDTLSWETFNKLGVERNFPSLIQRQTKSHYLKNIKMSLNFKIASDGVLVAHACNPGYLEDRDQEDHSSKPAW
jgi:hypothetical protein